MKVVHTGEAAILALELAEELAAVATLLEEHARDAIELDQRTVEQLARLIRRGGDQIAVQLGQVFGGR